MATISLQQQIIDQISKIEDVTLLEKIKIILDSSKYQLSQDQIFLVNEADHQYKNRDFIDEKTMDEKIQRMAKKVIWLKNAEIQMFSIMDYYQERNKVKSTAKNYIEKLRRKLKKLDSKIAFPQKTSIQDLYYFTHNHISVFFSITKTEIIVKLIWDERRDPQSLNFNLGEIV